MNRFVIAAVAGIIAAAGASSDARAQVTEEMIAGDRDIEQGAVSVRLRSGEDLGGMPIQDFIAHAKQLVDSKAVELS